MGRCNREPGPIIGLYHWRDSFPAGKQPPVRMIIRIISLMQIYKSILTYALFTGTVCT